MNINFGRHTTQHSTYYKLLSVTFEFSRTKNRYIVIDVVRGKGFSHVFIVIIWADGINGICRSITDGFRMSAVIYGSRMMQMSLQTDKFT